MIVIKRIIFFLCLIYTLTGSLASGSELPNDLQSKYNETTANYNYWKSEYDTQTRESKYVWIMGAIQHDYGDTIYLRGSGQGLNGDFVFGGYDNIKVTNVDRSYVNTPTQSYNREASQILSHEYQGMETGYNALGLPISIYVYRFEPEETNRMNEILNNLNNASNRLAEVNNQISAYKFQTNYTAYQRGLIYYNNGHDWNNAWNSFNQAVKEHPSDARAHFYLGVMYHEAGKLDDALYEFSVALNSYEKLQVNQDNNKELHDKFSEINLYYYRGHVYGMNGQYDEAFSDLEKAYSLARSSDRNLAQEILRQLALVDDVLHGERFFNHKYWRILQSEYGYSAEAQKFLQKSSKLTGQEYKQAAQWKVDRSH